MTMIVYADFTSAAGYLASRRVDALGAVGVDVEWRAVETRPDLPVPGLHSDAERSRLADGLAATRRLLLPGEALPGDVPTLLAKTEAAVTAYAEALGAGVGDEVRRLLFELYWVDGIDIGSVSRLRTPLAGPFKRGHAGADPLDYAGFPVSVDRGPITTEAWRRIRGWRIGWQRLGVGALPVLLAEDGLVLHGEDAVRRLGKELTYHEATPEPELENARRYPDRAVYPMPTWSSWHGGRYLNRFRPSALA